MERLRTYCFDSDVDIKEEFEGTGRGGGADKKKAIIKNIGINNEIKNIRDFKLMIVEICQYYYQRYMNVFFNIVKNQTSAKIVTGAEYENIVKNKKKEYHKIANNLYVRTNRSIPDCFSDVKSIVDAFNSEDKSKIFIQYYHKNDYSDTEWNGIYKGEVISDSGPLSKKLSSDNYALENVKTDYDYNEEFETDLLDIILYGPPGTGKTYNIVRYALSIIKDLSLEGLNKSYDNSYNAIKKQYDHYVQDGQIKFVTFHQSYGYEEFIEGIKPIIKDGNICYEVVPGVFKEFCKVARNDSNKYFVFIIDEINRGNISKIFGELITLIEESKREGADEAASAILPYSKEVFSVPKNVYILGTMNTADRSIAIMDTALRRRFHFIEMMPDASVLNGIKVEGIDIPTMLEMMNKRIEALYDREHTIGHAFFCRLIENSNIAVLADIFKEQIIPLLQEYFYEDYEKIRLVLGDHAKDDEYQFVQRIENKKSELFKGKDIEKYTRGMAECRYVINENAFIEPQSYIEIYE